MPNLTSVLGFLKTYKTVKKAGKDIVEVYDDLNQGYKAASDAYRSAVEAEPKHIRGKGRDPFKYAYSETSGPFYASEFSKALVVYRGWEKTSILNPVKMPRFVRKRKRRGKRSHPAKRRRRANRKRTVRRKRRVALSTRYIPLAKTMKFDMFSQITILGKTGAWGCVKFPLNTMEKPLAYAGLTAGTFTSVMTTVGTNTRRPIGMDRWIGSTADQGKYSFYQVTGCKITITHMPASRIEEGPNLISGVIPYSNYEVSHTHTSDSALEEHLEGIVAGQVAPLLQRKGPFKQLRMYNKGVAGQTWTINWSEKAHRKRFPEYRSNGIYSADLRISGTDNIPEAGVAFPLVNGYFMVGMLGDSAAQSMDYILKFEYTCKLTAPTQFSTTVVDVDAAGGDLF